MCYFCICVKIFINSQRYFWLVIFWIFELYFTWKSESDKTYKEKSKEKNKLKKECDLHGNCEMSSEDKIIF